MTSRSTPAHDRHRAVRARLSAVAALVASLTVLGTGVASAAWWASASASSNAAAATVGIQRTAAGDLGVTYSSTTTGAATAVTITNTSSREGTYTLTVAGSTWSGASDPRSSISVAIGTAATCTASASPTSASTGTLASPVSKSGTLNAGASTTLCIVTSMTSAAITANPSRSASGTISVGLAVGTWSASTTPTSFTQQVAAAPGFQPNQIGRYRLFNQNGCIQTNWSFTALSRGSSTCPNDQISEWRLANGPNGSIFIHRAHNSGGTTADRVAVVSGAITLVTANDTVTAQQWKLIDRGNGTFRIENVGNGLCMEANSSNAIVLATCNNTLARQGFTFTLIGNPQPATPYLITCTLRVPNDPSVYLEIEWPSDPAYVQEREFRLYASNKLVNVTYLNKWNLVGHLHATELAAAGVAFGSAINIRIEQRNGNSPWVTVAERTISYTSPTSMGCG